MIRKKQQILSLFYALCDFFVFQIMFVAAWYIKFQSGWLHSEQYLTFKTYLMWSIVYGIIAVLVGLFLGLYLPKRKKNFSFEALKILQVNLIGVLLLSSLLFVYKEVHVSREFLAIFFMLNIFSINFYRYVVKFTLKYYRQKGYNKQFVLILGAGSLGEKFYDSLQQHPELGFEVVGFLDDFQIDKGIDSRPILGTINDVESVLQNNLIDEVIIALPISAHSKYGHIISVCEKAGVKTLIIPDFFDILPARPHFEQFAGIPIINIREIPLEDLGNRIIKRAFDLVFSFTAILLTFPLMSIIAIVIKATSKGPVIFKQERVGLNRRLFCMYKFRTMKVLENNISDQQWTVENDPRRTKFGTFLRKTSLDELPQFFNVLLGQMSIVGPRPERPYFVDQFKEEIPKYMIKHHVRPGITGWAQSNGLRGDTSIFDRISYDLFYIENWTFYFDIKIIWKTVFNGIVNKNAY